MSRAASSAARAAFQSTDQEETEDICTSSSEEIMVDAVPESESEPVMLKNLYPSTFSTIFASPIRFP